MLKFICIFIIFIHFVCCKEICDSVNLVCAEEKLVSYIDEFEKVHNVGDHIYLEKIKESPRGKIDRKENVVERSLRFLQEHELKIKLPNLSEARDIIEGRARRLRKILIPVLLFLKLKFAVILSLVFSVIKFITFKSYQAAIVALIIAGIASFKSMIDVHKPPKISYEFIPTVWGRTGLEKNNISPLDPMNSGYHTIVDRNSKF